MKLSDIFSVGTKATQAVNQVSQTQAELKQSVDEAKKAAVTAYGITTGLQLLSTIAICSIAYVTIQNYRKGRK